MYFNHSLLLPRWISCLLLVVFLSACEKAAEDVKAKRPAKTHLVEVVEAQRMNIAIERERTGTLMANQEIQIYNQEEGQIISLPFFEGDQVTQGELLVSLDDRLLQTQLARTQALRRKAEQDLKRIRGLANKQMAAQIELTRLETELAVARADEKALQTRLNYTQILSPINGVVSQRLSEPGNIAERYTHLLTVSDQSRLTTEVSVSELLINKLQMSAEVDIEIDALQQVGAIKGRIERIHPNLNPVTRTGLVEISLEPVPQGARPGQLARIKLRTQEAERLLIPFTALRRDSEGEYVFIVNDKQQAQKVAVLSGLRIAENIEILKGIDAKQYVVIRGFTDLRDQQKVTVVNSDALTSKKVDSENQSQILNGAKVNES